MLKASLFLPRTTPLMLRPPVPSTPAMVTRSLATRRGSCRAARGLYGGKDVGFGNKVSHSERKTRRMWKPNVHKKRPWSEALNEFIKFDLTTHTLRCVDKAGGLDKYLLNMPDKKLNSIQGEEAKRRIQQALAESSS
eukprot:FR735617.1.p3 GENE.FR735617.1~~FR735617.1.p3  ORF type:complete len:137 (+),score=12.32 FR735617.1:110-520(+)